MAIDGFGRYSSRREEFLKWIDLLTELYDIDKPWSWSLVLIEETTIMLRKTTIFDCVDLILPKPDPLQFYMASGIINN